jgi:hypothetical protein
MFCLAGFETSATQPLCNSKHEEREENENGVRNPENAK